LFQFRLVRHALPAALDLWLGNSSLHSLWFCAGGCFRELLGSSDQQFVPLHFRQRSRLHCGRQIRRSLSLDRQPLDRTARVSIHNGVIRAVIVNDVVLNGDVRHVHRVGDVRNILHSRKNPVAQNRLADKPHIAEVVILRANIERYIHVRADRLSFINDARSARRQRRPTDVIATGTP
jgi:hypothetical protein